jgi:hypothetical protein
MKISKYHLLERSDEDVQHIWSMSDLRGFNLTYIVSFKKYLGRYYNKEIQQDYGDPDSYFFWLIWNLEKMGKPKLAERMYIIGLSKGVIKGL